MDVNDSELFVVAMGAFDVAEVCVLVGNFLLHKLSEKYGRKNLALYRDDGLRMLVGQPHKNLTNIFVICLENMNLDLHLNAIEKWWIS